MCANMGGKNYKVKKEKYNISFQRIYFYHEYFLINKMKMKYSNSNECQTPRYMYQYVYYSNIFEHFY